MVLSASIRAGKREILGERFSLPFGNTEKRVPLKRIIYVHRSSFPGPKAHHAAIVKMIDAFSENLEVILFLRRYQRDFASNIKKYFMLERDLNIKSPLSLGFLPFRLDFVYKWHLDRELSRISDASPYGESAVYYRYSESTGRHMAALARRHRIPFFCEIHTERRSRGEIEYLKEMKGIVVITDWLRDHLTEIGVDPAKILTAPSGVDTGLYDRERHGKGAGAARLSHSSGSLVVYTGKPYKGRGVETLIESARFLDDSVSILIVGCLPEDFKRLDAMVENLGLRDKVRLEGHKPLNQIPRYQLSADVLVMPYSKDWNLKRAASPVKMFEYMASGNPIVASDFPNIREVLSEENSVLVPPDDPCLLAAGITRCLEDKAFANLISANALERVKMYGWNGRAAKVTDFMNSVL